METMKQVGTRQRWESQARCRGLNTNDFFPEVGTNTVGFLRKFCLECPVARECLDFAIENSMDYGVWGGMSVEERIAIRLGRKAHPYATVRR
jgi:WhiB family redox-sensing transcriptional regulator